MTRLTIYLIAAGTIILDIVTKITVFVTMSEGQSIKILPNIFHITLVLNKGTAFGLLKGFNIFFIITSFIAAVLIILYIGGHKKMDQASMVALGFILGGAIGNMVNRVRFGCVIDFLDFRVWPVFNIADSCITVGVVILITNMLMFRKLVR